eukprot:COSAG06_NODE_84_length_25090_cov_20.561042_6_plen_90_part_00
MYIIDYIYYIVLYYYHYIYICICGSCRRTLAHRVLANEGDAKRPRSLLERHSVPLLIVNAEHDIGCAKGNEACLGRLLPNSLSGQLDPL